jgi:hypothetical protein
MRSSRTSLKIFHAGHLIIHYPFDLIDQPVNNANQWRLQWRGLETGAASLQAPLPNHASGENMNASANSSSAHPR